MPAGSLTESLRETLALFDESGAPRTTTEIAERLNIGRRSTYERLERLVDQGRLETKKVGANARVWWRPSTGRGVASPDWPAAAESLVGDVLERADVGVFVLDENFEIAWINEATERYFGLDRDGVLGRDKRAVVEETIATRVEDADAFAETVLATYDDNTYTERFECRVTAGEGRKTRWLEHRSKPIESGAYAGGRVELYYDVTEQKRTERARADDRRQFESLIEAVEEYAIFTLDAEGRVRTWNPGAEAIKGYAEDEIVGEHLSEFYTDEDRAADVPERNLAAAAEQGSIEVEGWRVREDGSRFWASATITAIRGEDGDLEGYAKVTRDMTDRREREEQLRQERDLTARIFEAAPVSLGVLDSDGTFVRTNRRMERAIGGADGPPTIGDVDIRDESGDLVPPGERPYMDIFDTGDPVDGWECQIDLPGGSRRWISVHAVPVDHEDGDGGDDDRVILAAEDVTRLKRQARQLERRRDELESELDEMFERISDGFYALDEDLQFTYQNDRAASLLDLEESAVIGREIRDAIDLTDRFEAALKEALKDGDPVFLEDHYDPLDGWFENAIYPSESGLSIYFRNVTDRKERERKLEESRRRYQTLVEHFPNGAVALVDEDLRYVTIGGEPIEEVDATIDDLEGTPIREVLPPEVADALVPGYRDALAGVPGTIETEIGDRIYLVHFVPVRDDDGDVFAAIGMSQDVTEQKERERALRDAKTQLEAATEAGSVGTWEWDVPEDRFVTGGSLSDIFGIYPEETREGVPLDRILSAIHEEDRDRVERAIETAVSTCGEYEEEYRVRDADGELRWVVARGRAECDEDGDAVSFPGALTDITDRKRAERELERQRERLAALDDLNSLVHEITDAVIDQSTREEIERVVCEHLADADSYAFAWIGDVDVATETVDLRTEAGVDGYLDDVTISVDPDDDRSEGPTGRALRTGEMQVTRDVAADRRHDPWREHVEAYDFRSSAAIPIAHEGTIYGVLNVYAERPDAFTGEERSVIGQLGEIVGHAIAGAERKRALMSDEVVELQFRIQDLFDALDLDAPGTGRITIDHTVPIHDREFLVYGTATPDAVETLSTIVETLPHWDDVSIRSGDAPREFQVRLTEPPVLTTVASLGGSVDDVVIEDGDYRMTIQLAPGSGVRQVIDAVQTAYPAAEMVKRTQRTRATDASGPVQHALVEELTDRQRSALEAAYHSGFFDWPREASGEDVAASLGVAPPTFHQHLRKAQRKVFDSLMTAQVTA